MVNPFPANRSLSYTVSGSAAFEKVVQRESLDGSRILVPAFICENFLRSIFERYEMDPVFCDVDTETYHLDFEQAKPHLPAVDAVLLVHAFGLPAHIDQWVDCCQDEDVVLIEDCARALGARYDGRSVGERGEYAIFSLSKVSPLFTGGVLAAAPTQSPVELTAPSINADLLIKFLYNELPWELPYKEQIWSLYETVIGDRQYVTQETEQDLLATGDDSAVRQLDPLNRWLFDQYLDHRFPQALSEHRSIATALRQVLETYDFDVQPTAIGRVHYVLSATVRGDRDAVVDYLQSRGHPVQVIWDEPWGLCYDRSFATRSYPGTEYLAENVITFPIAEMSQGDVTQIARDLRAYYETHGTTPRLQHPDYNTVSPTNN